MAVKSFMDGHDLLQLISSPTYNVNTSKPALLDLFFIARPLAPSVVSTTTLPPVADHCAIIVSLSIKKAPALKPYTKECWDYNSVDVTSLQERMATCDWPVNVGSDLNSTVQRWQNQFLDICASVIPRRRFRV